MDLKHLAAVLAVADLGTVNKAAGALRLSQPSVTRQIKLLEAELGTTLFDRTPRGMTPTPSGEVLVEHARRALRELDRAQAEIQADNESVTGIVSVGLLESIAELVAEPLVMAISGRHPGIDLRLHTAYSGHLQEWLDSGNLDLSFLYDLTATTSLHVTPVVEEQLWAVAPAGAGLTPGTPVSVSELADHPLVLPTPDHGLRNLIDEALQHHDQPRVLAQVNSMALQKALVVAGSAWTVLPASGVARAVAEGLMTAAPINTPSLTRQVVLGFRPRARMPRALAAVIGELGRATRTLVTSGTWAGARLASTLADEGAP